MGAGGGEISKRKTKGNSRKQDSHYNTKKEETVAQATVCFLLLVIRVWL